MDERPVTEKIPGGYCVVIPAYNNGGTLERVIERVLKITANIIVVNDGSTDNTSGLLKRFPEVEAVSYEKNRGKGYALRKGFEKASERGFSHAVTIDADGQHNPEDMLPLIELSEENPEALIIGARNIRADGMPGKNTFANRFSNFWYRVETGKTLPDTQSGFRIYPLSPVAGMRFFSLKYEFELEALVRLTWKGVPVLTLPVSVSYPDDRVSHFRPFRDFTRITILNTILVLWALFYVYPEKLFRYLKHNKLTGIVKEQMTVHNENPSKVAYALGFGVFMGIVPIWGFQMLTAAFLAHLMKLNKVLVLIASNISLPPFIPFIIYFSYKTGGILLGAEQNLSSETVERLKDQVLSGAFYQTINDLGYSILQYIIGSFVFAAIAGIVVMLFTLFTFSVYKPQPTKH